MTEEGLLEKLKKGENEAFQLVYQKGFPLIYRLVLQNNGTKRDAQDLMQDTIFCFVKKLRKPDFKLSCQLTTYLYAVGRNLWLTKLKAKGKELLEVDEPSDYIVIEDDGIEQKQKQEEKYEVVAAVLSQMKEKCRKIILAFYYEKTPLKELAKVLNLTAESMKVTKHRCMKELKKRVAANTSYQALTHKNNN